MSTTFYSNGKLFISGEYLVLDGADAFALPTKFGQNLVVENGENNTIEWKSYDYDQKIWFEDTFTFAEIITNADSEIERLQVAIRAAMLEQTRYAERWDHLVACLGWAPRHG